MKKILTLFAMLLVASSMAVVQAVDYYYRGNQNNWGATLMTTSTDGYYAYISAKGKPETNDDNIFKISTTTETYDYGCSIASPGFNGTDVTVMNDKNNSWGKENSNNAVYHDASYYILVYFPNTVINDSNDPVMCASTSLPFDGDPATPTVAFVGVPTEVYKGQTVTFAATSENVDNPVYSYLVDGVAATSPYTFNVAGSHTVTVEVRSNGTGDATTANMTVDCKEYSLMANDHSTKGTKVADCTTSDGITFTATWNCIEAGNYYFYVTTNTSSDANTNCDYLCGGQTLTNGVNKAAYLYGTSDYGHSYTLNAEVTGEYTFTLTLGENNYFKCDFPAAAPEPDAFVAGSITDIFGSPAWKADQEDNKMTWDEGSSLYTKSFTVDKAYKSVGLKVFYGGEWYGDNEDNVKFSLSGAGTFTVKFNKTSHAVSVEGEIVEDEQFDFNYITVAGNGTEGNSWVHGEDWNAAAAANRMTEVATDIYEISYSEVKGVESKFQFTFDGGWDYQFGGTFSEFGTATTAVFGNSGGNITFTPTEGADITIRLDLSAFNFATKEGATFTVSQLEPVPDVKIKGTVVNGSWEEDPLNLEVASDRKSASITIAIPQPGDYEFKMILGDDEWRSNGYTYHRDYIGAAGIDGNEDANMKLEAEVAGNYTFKWIYANDSLHIDFPECNYYIKNNWYGCGAWKWKGMTKDNENGTYRIENVVYGGNGVNYNTVNSDEDATWKKDSVLFYMDGNKQKKLMAYDTVNFVLDPANDTIWAEMVKKDVTVYTVASNSLALCDLGWQPTHPHKYTDMKKQADGTYKWTKDDDEVVLLAGSVYFKVIKNRAYENGSWPYDDSLECVIPQSGIYTIEVTFNPCTHNMTATPTLKKALNINNLIIKGSWDEKPLVLNGENDKALVTLPLEVGEYDFRLWDVESNRYGNAQAFTRANNSHRGIVAESGGADMTINVDKAGEYLFTYIFESEQLVVSYPAIVPDVKIAPLSGKFTINAKGDTAVFSRGNLQYNFGEQAWYAAEKQYEVLSDLNLRFGDDSYQGSIDMFGWSCDDSNYGLLKSNLDADFTGNFVDWGTKFTDDEKEWSSLSRAEWDYLLLSRTKNSQYLWSMIALGPDSLRGLALFPDNWEAPAGLTINYGFYNFDDKETLKANSFSYAQWEQMEAAGAVFLPNAGVRAGYIGNTGAATNPLTGWYCWMDNVSDYGFYWLSSKPSSPIEADMLAAPWINNQNKYVRPMTTTRQRRYGHAVRLVTRIPRVDYIREDLTEGRYGTICLPSAGTISNAKLYDLEYYDGANTLYLLEVNGNSMEAGRPYIFLPSATLIEVIYTDKTKVDAGSFNGLIGSLDAENVLITPNAGNYILYNNQYYFVDDEAYVAPNRAYIHMDDVPTEPSQTSQGNAPRRRIAMTVHGEQNATGFDELNASEAPAKMVIDGRLYILRGEKIYDATGRLVK